MPREYEKMVTISCINYHPVWGSTAANLEKMKSIAREAALQGSNIIIFPELALSGYECDPEAVEGKKPCDTHRQAAELVPGPSTEEMAAVAREHGVYIVFGMPEQDRAKPRIRYISAAVVGPEGIMGTSRKLHLVPPPLGSEQTCFTPGSFIRLFDTKFGPIGVVICFDFWFYPELARLMALKGARILVNPSASFSGPSKASFMVRQTAACATSNGVCVASANLVGKEKTKSYYGHSCISAPNPPRLSFVDAEGSGKEEEIVSATIDLTRLDQMGAMLDWRKDRQAKLILDELQELNL
ncbi:MAG: carbon-nitrogen hydrolase family protein [Dehalococcoidia bacterium]